MPVNLSRPICRTRLSTAFAAWTLCCGCSHGMKASGDASADCREQNDAGSSIESGGTQAESGGLGPVVGRVVAIGWGRALPGRTVVIEGHRTTTDRSGSFTFDMVPARYDAYVVEPDERQLSIYYGLTRRDPILSHVATSESTLDEPPYSAAVSGTLLGEFPFPLADNYRRAAVYFFGDSAYANWHLDVELAREGPGYGPMVPRWSGPASLAGTLVALGRTSSESREWAAGFAASAALEITNGQAITQDLPLSQVSIGRIAGRVLTQQGTSVERALFTYRFPGASGDIRLAECGVADSYDCELPDLTDLGGEYCVTVFDDWAQAQATRCGGKIGMSDLTISISAPPALVKPADGSPITKDSKVGWTSVADAVYLLDAGPDLSTPASPHIRAYTANTSMEWPDLQPLGLSVSSGTSYTLRLSAFVPYASMDELSSERGLAIEGIDRQQLESGSVNVVFIQ
jgi:hypothetical protein